MRQMTILGGILAGFALISLAGIAPALAQSNPDPKPGVVPVGTEPPLLDENLDPLPRYAVVKLVRPRLPGDLPVGVLPVDPRQPEARSSAFAGDTVGERPAVGVGASVRGRQGFRGMSAVAVLPERHVNVERVRAELADLRADLGL